MDNENKTNDLKYYEDIVQKQNNLLIELENNVNENEIKITNLKNLNSGNNLNKNKILEIDSWYNKHIKIKNEIQYIFDKYNTEEESKYVSVIDNLFEKMNKINLDNDNSLIKNNNEQISNLKLLSIEIKKFSVSKWKQLEIKLNLVKENLNILKNLWNEKNISHKNIEITYNSNKILTNNLNSQLKEVETLNKNIDNKKLEIDKNYSLFKNKINLESIFDLKNNINSKINKNEKLKLYLNKEYKILLNKFENYKKDNNNINPMKTIKKDLKNNQENNNDKPKIIKKHSVILDSLI